MTVERRRPRGFNGRRTERAAKDLELADRRRQVAGYVLARVPQREIAALLGVAVSTVNGDVSALREEWRLEAQRDLEDWRAEELAALAADEQSLRARMIQAAENMQLRLQIYDRILKIGERRARLLGLDKPIRVDLTMLVRALAEREGFDPEKAVELAARLVPMMETLALPPGGA